MYMVHFDKSHTKRYDDTDEMGRDIATWLQRRPEDCVKVVYYV
jgi:hypothetical protein